MVRRQVGTDFNPYRILSVEPYADQAAIDAAYRALADAGDGRRLEIETAYRILSDPEQRRAYDERLREALANPPAQPTWPDPDRPTSSRKRLGAAPWTIGDMAWAIVAVVVTVIAVGLPLAVVAALIAGSSDEVSDDPNALALALGANLIVEVALAGAAYWFAVRKYGLRWSALGLRRPDRGRVLLTLGLIGGAYLIVFGWGLLLSALGIEPDTDLPEQAFDDWRPLAAVLVLSVLFAPFAEELFFRGFIFGGLLPRWGLPLAMLGSGVLFSLAHGGNPGYFVVLPAIVGIGALFAWGYWYSGSLYPSIAAHFVFNSVSMIASIVAET
jgi:hypothetical protein